MRRSGVLSLLMLCCLVQPRTAVGADASGDYRSKATGNWSATSTWERHNGTSWVAAVATPTSTDGVITLKNGFIVTVTAAVAVDQLVVDLGAELDINSGIVLTVGNGGGVPDMLVNGTVVVAGTLHQQTGSTGSAVQVAGSLTVLNGGIVDGSGGNVATAPTFTVNSGGTWTINSGGAMSAVGRMNVYINAGGTATLNGIMNMGPALTVDGILTSSADITTSSVSILTINGTLTMTAGTLSLTRGNGGPLGSIRNGGTLNLSGTSSLVIDSVNVAYVDVLSGGTLGVGATAFVSGSGFLAVASGANLKIGSAYGITTDTSTGNVRTGGTDTYSTGGNYTFNGTANQVTGSGFPSTVNAFIVNPGAANSVTLSASLTVSTSTTVSSGTLIQGCPNNFSGGILSLSGGNYQNCNAASAGGTGTLALAATTVAAGSTFDYVGTGQITFSGDVSNSGIIRIDGGSRSAGTPDCAGAAVNLRSSSAGVARAWSGSGNFLMRDVNFQDQTTSGAITAYKTSTKGTNTAGWTADNATCGTATAVRLISFTAQRAGGGAVELAWTTGWASDNLGFNLYREVNGVRALITPSLIAGSGLQGTVTTQSYTWHDAAAPADPVTYYLEDVDVTRIGLLHGPITPVGAVVGGGSSSPLLGGLNGPSLVNGGSPGQRTFVPLGVSSGSRPAAERLQQQWALEASGAIKLHVRAAGWYHVRQADLVAAGLPPAVDPAALQLFLRGEEQALRVIPGADGQFDASAAIEFYATGVDTPYTDTQVYWLFAGQQPGRRVATVDGTRAGPAGAASFELTVERKDRTIPWGGLRNGDAETWFGPIVDAWTEASVPLTLAHLAPVPAGPATLRVSLQGVTASPGAWDNHQVGVTVNGVAVGQVVFAGQALTAATLSVDPALLLDGDNTITLVAQGGDEDVTLVDAVQLTYAHTYAADGDLLFFTAAGGHQVRLTGFTSAAIQLIDVTDPAQPAVVLGLVTSHPDGYALTALVPGVGVRALYAVTPTTRATPTAIRANHASTWAAAGNADYVVITPARFAANWAPLVAWRQVQRHTTALVDVDDLYDAFSYGEKTPQAIKAFLMRAHAVWQTPPRFIVLGGDATSDPRNYAGLGDADFVPTKMIDLLGVAQKTASDDWFADVAGNGLPGLAFVGRLSVRTPAEADTVVAKIITYESTVPGAWNKQVLFVADANDLSHDFEAASTSLAAGVPSAYTATTIFKGQLGTVAARAALLADLNAGQGLVNYVGHGSTQVWSATADLFTTDDVATLSNEGRLSIVVAMNCLNGYFQSIYAPEASLAEALLRVSTGGAVAVWASSGVTEGDGQVLADRALLQALMTGAYHTLGEAVAAAKGATPALDVRRTWILFGDPALVVTHTSPPAGPADVDGDRKADLALYRPSTGVWYIKHSSTDYATYLAYQWGLSTDVAVAGEYDGDGKTDLAVYRPSTGVWYILQSSTNYTTYLAQQWGLSTDVPVPGDYDGDGKTDLGVYRPSTGAWYILLSSTHFTSYVAQQWGLSSDLPVVADYDGDGKADLGLYRPSIGYWYILQSSSNYTTYLGYQWGLGTDIVVPGDYDGDGRADLGVYRPSTGTWYILQSSSHYTTHAAHQWGFGTDLVVPADYDGDGRADLGVYRPSTGYWYILLSSTTYTTYLAQQWGQSSDIPVLQRQ